MNLSKDIINWLIQYNKTSNTKCFVVGISGGIDSATVSTLCAMTGIETHVVSLPLLQNDNQLNLAKNHINWLKTNFKNVVDHEIDLSEIFLNFKKTFSDFNDDLSYANSRSRLRMVSLYQIAGYSKGIVVGTGNKIEDFGIGFFTKYGDGGVDISPIADLTKTEVRELGKELGVINDILIAKPTDGLWDDDRNDEDQIGATYIELEWAMDYMEKNSSEKLTERQEKVLNIYNNLNNKNKHKMLSIPVFIKK